MAQVTIYLPDAVLDDLKRRAKRARKSVSAYVAELVTPTTAGAWPAEFRALYGSWEGSFDTPEDPPPTEIEALR